eukprot:541007-Prymnesium_polylepis.2
MVQNVLPVPAEKQHTMNWVRNKVACPHMEGCLLRTVRDDGILVAVSRPVKTVDFNVPATLIST